MDFTLYRCDDCGHTQTVFQNAPALKECCHLGDLRNFSLLRVASADGTDWTKQPNLKRSTVDGPPQLLWLQGGDAYGLYVGGKNVRTIEGRHLSLAKGSAVVGAVNELLAIAFRAS